MIKVPNGFVTGREDDWAQRVGAFQMLPALIRGLGADSAAILKRVGLPANALDNAENRVSYPALALALREAAGRTNCPHLGLLVGRMWRVSDLGVVGELVCNSPTVGDALRMLTDYQYLNSAGALAFIIERGPVVDLGYAIYHPNSQGPDVMYDVLGAVAVNLMRELCGLDFRPIEVLLPHKQPVDITHYRNLFKAPVRFNSEICALRFPVELLKQPVDCANSERLRAAKERADHLPRPELLQQVCHAIRALMLRERHSGDDVAEMLDMHRRTLSRRLQAQGVTFQQVLDNVRFATACEHLAVSDISLDDIAATLGYAGVSPFMRTFYRWAGTTPGRWRRTRRDTPGAICGVY